MTFFVFLANEDLQKVVTMKCIGHTKGILLVKIVCIGHIDTNFLPWQTVVIYIDQLKNFFVSWSSPLIPYIYIYIYIYIYAHRNIVHEFKIVLVLNISYGLI